MSHKLISLISSALIGLAPLCAQEFEDAFAAVANFGPGWNLGNTLDSNSGSVDNMWIEMWGNGKPEAWETAWGQPMTKRALIHMFKKAGFNAIRVPVTWYPHMGNVVSQVKANGGKWDKSTWDSYDVDPAWMARVHEIVDYVIDEDMYCIINVHHDTGGGDTAWLVADREAYEQERERFEALWTQIALEFQDYGEKLLFAGYNEMLDTYDSWCFASFATAAHYDAEVAASAYDGINGFAQSFVDAVRATGGNNACRNLIVNTYASCNGSGTWNEHLDDPLKEMLLPADEAENHLIFEVHSYFDVKNVTSAKNDVDAVIADVQKYLESKGAPVVFGEWGITTEDPKIENHCEYAKYFTQKAKEAGMGMFYWMVLSDGEDRSVPRWTNPALKDAILQGYYGDDYNSINDIAIDCEDCTAPIYNLQGIRLPSMPTAPGIYLRNGRKFLIR